MCLAFCFFFKQKTAYEMRISDWSSDVCSSDLAGLVIFMGTRFGRLRPMLVAMLLTLAGTAGFFWSGMAPVFFIANVGTAITWSFVVMYLFGMLARLDLSGRLATLGGFMSKLGLASGPMAAGLLLHRSEEHTSALQSLMRISYAVFCLKQKK